MAFWLWSTVTVWWWTSSQQVSFHLLHKAWVTDSFRDGHGHLHSSSYICDGPASQQQLRHPPAQHRFSLPSALPILQGPTQPWEGGAGRTTVPAAHHGPPTNTPQRHSEVHSSNLISGIIAPSVLLQITFLSTTSIFSCETLIRKFKKSWMQRKHLAAIFTFDVLHFLPFPINTSLRWTLPKSNRWGVIYLPFSYYLPRSANTNAYDDMQTVLSEK